MRKHDSGSRAFHYGASASMGPQLYRCGNNHIPAEPADALRGFNGAATLSLRKPTSRRHLQIPQCSASMGPQLYRCGNRCIAITCQQRVNWLQWGRNFIVAETITAMYNRVHLKVLLQWGRNFIVAETTTRPVISTTNNTLQWGRNFIVAETCAARAPARTCHLASMGPQLYRCGNLPM